MATGLRERKKERTRAAIAEAALELFAQRGFDETTVAEIADAAEVSPRTFFTYFGAKEEVVFCGFEEDLASVRARLAARGEDESAVDAIRAWILDEISDPDFSDEDEVRRRRLIRDTPALAAFEASHVNQRFREVVVEAVADDLGVERSDLGPQMVGAAAVAAFGAMIDHFADTGGAGGLGASLDRVGDFLEGGLAAVERR